MSSSPSSPGVPTPLSPSPCGHPRLLRFMLYNSSFGPREGEEHKKIVFYHPPEHSEQEQATNVGFAEACHNFCSVFSRPNAEEDDASPALDGRVRVVRTRQTKTAFLKAEGEFVLTLTVSLPCAPARKKSSSSSRATSPGAEGASTPPSLVDYFPEDVPDRVLTSCLEHANDAFRFFGPAASFAECLELYCGGEEPDSREALRDVVSPFFSRFVPTIRRCVERRPHGPGLTDLYRPVQFLTLEAADFLRARCFCSQVQDEFPRAAARVVLFQQANVVWTDMQQGDTRLLYLYITQTLLPAALSSSSSNLLLSPSSAGGPFSGHQGRFLAGGPPSTRGDISAMEWRTPTVRLLHEATAEDGDQQSSMGVEHQLIVYHAVAATLCLLVPAVHGELPDEFFRQFDAAVGPRLTNLSADLLDVFGTSSSSSGANNSSIGGTGGGFMKTSPSTSSLSSHASNLASSGGMTASASASVLCSPIGGGGAPERGAAAATAGGGGGWQDLLSPSGPGARYFYFNRANLAMKSTLGSGGEGGGGSLDSASVSAAAPEPPFLPAVSAETSRVLMDMAEAFEERDEADSPLECCCKTYSDQWAAGKRGGGGRTLLAAVAAKCSTLMDASEEVDRLLQQDFRNVFMMNN